MMCHFVMAMIIETPKLLKFSGCNELIYHISYGRYVEELKGIKKEHPNLNINEILKYVVSMHVTWIRSP